ncbi:MAG: thioredoxin-dependent thiol peroxidase [Microbacteriaceae bacterium]|nr:thioredoxin-dependent thiol peroxidase [Microbacteriaceae bacterium]
MTASTRLEPGQNAPDFTLPDQDGRPLTLSELHGRKVVVYFYPEAMTPGCTTQACDFRDNLGRLQAAGYEVVGISRDEVPKLAEFAAHDHLTFRILSDPEHRIHDLYGAYGEKNLYGKTVVSALRSTFVIDERGVIVQALYNVKATGHVDMLLKRLGLAA